MELAELSKIQHFETAQKDTSRTIKPADRCVISYNFEQTNSNNYTHNLLIGMFNDDSKKTHKNMIYYSPDKGKHKGTALAPHPKKIFRQQASRIVKVYDSNPEPKKYVNSVSPRKQRGTSKSNHSRSQQQSLGNGKLPAQRETFFDKSNEDMTIQEGSYLTNPFRQTFNQQVERRKSPYHSNHKPKIDMRIKTNSIGSGEKNDLSGEQPFSGDHFYKKRMPNSSYKENSPEINQVSSFDRRKEGKNANSSAKRYQQSEAAQLQYQNEKANADYYQRKPEIQQGIGQDENRISKESYHHSKKLPGDRTHLKKVTENELQLNELSGKIEQSQLREGSPTERQRCYQAQPLMQMHRGQFEMNPSKITEIPQNKKKVQNVPVNHQHKEIANSSISNNLLGKKQVDQPRYMQPFLLNPPLIRLSQQISRNKKVAKQQGSQIRKSRKQIEDEQLRQIEQKVRKEEPGEFKKGYYKVSNKNQKEFLPFYADIEPVMQISKKKAKAEAPVNKTTLYKETAKATDKQWKNQTQIAGLTDKRAAETKINQNSNQNYEKGKQSSFKPNITYNKLEENGFPFQKIPFNQSKQPEQFNQRFNSINRYPNQFSPKNNSQFLRQKSSFNDLSKHRNNGMGSNNLQKARLTGNSFNIKRKENNQKSLKKIHESNYNHKSQEDITENNLIKGFQVPVKKINQNTSLAAHSKAKQQNSLNHHNSQPISAHLALQEPNGMHKQSINLSKQSNRQGKPSLNVVSGKQIKKEKNPNPNQQQATQNFNENGNLMKGNSRNNEIRQNSPQIQNNSLSKDNTNRTIKKNQERSLSKTNKLRTQSQGKSANPRSQNAQLGSKNHPQPTVPRKAKDKNRKFKDWRQSQLQQARRESRQRKRQNSSGSKRVQKTSIVPPKSSLKPSGSKLSKQIDLDAQEQDRFGLLAQKNVTSHKSKGSKRNNSLKRAVKSTKSKTSGSVFSPEQKKDSSEQQRIRQEEQQNSKTSHENQSQQSQSEHSIDHSRQSNCKQESKKSSQHSNSRCSNSVSIIHQENLVNPALQISTKNPEGNLIAEEHMEPLNQKLVGQDNPKTEGVEEIQHLIEQNGSEISRIDSNDSNIAQEPQTKREHTVFEKEERRSDHSYEIIISPELANKQSNLEQLLKATEEVQQNNKELEPILNNVEVQLGKPQTAPIQDTEVVAKTVDEEKQPEELAVNLPLPLLDPLVVSEEVKQSPRGLQNQTDYHEQYMDNIAEMPSADPNKEHNSRTDDFFQCNLRQNSKISETNQTVNFTKYQVVDKDTNHYTRAPIFSFIYQVPNESNQFSFSSVPCTILKKLKEVAEIGQEIIDQAISTLLSIDTWIIERIFEPFEEANGKIGVWLNCHGRWKLYLQSGSNFRLVLKKAVRKALQQINEYYDLQSVIKMLSGVRVMKLKSTKRKIFNELQYSLKKGHVIKAYSSLESKWKGKIFEVAKVEVTRQNENVLQIKQQGDTYWVKEQKFKEIFEHFLLICTRHSHYWTYRQLEHKQKQKTVVNITSLVPSHGSLTLFYPSEEPSSLLLYKELQSKVLKYMGKIQQKRNQNGNLYFEFKLHGTYVLFLQTPASCRLAIQSTSPLEIGEPEYIVSQTLKNAQCEYVQLSHAKSKGKQQEGDKTLYTLQRLKEKFINLVVKK